MNKTLKIYGSIFFVVVILLVLLELSKNEVTNWTKNFDIQEKTPFGLFIFNQEANHVFDENLSRTVMSPYAFYEENQKMASHNILVVEKNIDQESWKKIFEQVSAGSDAMIVSSRILGLPADTLGFVQTNTTFDDSHFLKFTDQKMVNDKLFLDKFPGGKGFSFISKNAEILGYSSGEEQNNSANFIRVKFGKGNFYLHSEPLFLTNYYLLYGKNSKKYFENVFSYLPKRNTVWFVETTGSGAAKSPLSFILSKPALRYAWWCLLAGLLLFIFFNAKRKQRIVPVIEPLKNKSAEFVKSVGNLYLQEGDFHDMMARKAQYFLNRIRLDFMIDTTNLDESFAKKLQLKTGTTIEKINEAINLIKKAQDPYAAVMKEDLMRMNQLLDEIVKN